MLTWSVSVRFLTFGVVSPGSPWTVLSLAKTVGMSRAGFARRFRDVVGTGPLKYLGRWRMLQISWTALRRDYLQSRSRWAMRPRAPSGKRLDG